MIKQLNEMKPKELRQFQKALNVVKKSLDLTDEDIEMFVVLLKHSREFTKIVTDTNSRITALERESGRKADSENASIAKKMQEYLNKGSVKVRTNV